MTASFSQDFLFYKNYELKIGKHHLKKEFYLIRVALKYLSFNYTRQESAHILLSSNGAIYNNKKNYSA